MCGPDARSSVLHGFVRDAELAEVVANHLRLSTQKRGNWMKIDHYDSVIGHLNVCITGVNTNFIRGRVGDKAGHGVG